ncbi:MAG: PPOX class F420-dependent oxidoreductase [Anaerolineales bacterium]
MNASEIFRNHKYINLTTFRKNGNAVPTPVWFVELEGELYVFTGSQTGKAKRIRANGRASVAPSDARGNPLGEFIPMRATFVNDINVIKLANQRYQQKYGFQRTLMNWLNSLRERKDTPVLIRLSTAE